MSVNWLLFRADMGNHERLQGLTDQLCRHQEADLHDSFNRVVVNSLSHSPPQER